MADSGHVMIRPLEAAHRDRDLPAEGHRVPVVGPARDLAWPAMCPNCGNPASTPIRVYKAFRRKGRSSPWRYYLRSIDIPYCEPCTQRHFDLLDAPPGLFSGSLAVFRTPLIIPLAGATIMGSLLWRSLLEALGDPNSRLIALAIAAVLVLAAASSIASGWWAFRFRRAPKQTEVTRACEFSDNLGSIFTGVRRIFVIRNARFAEAFAAVNRDRLWTGERRARDNRIMAVVTVVGVTLLVAAWWFGIGRR